MPTWLPSRMLDAAEQRDFLSGVQPYLADLQQQVQTGISDLTSTVTGLTRQAELALSDRRESNGAPRPAITGAPAPLPGLDTGGDRGYLGAASSSPPALPDLGGGSAIVPSAVPPRTAQAAPSPIEPFTLPSFESLTGGAQAAPTPPPGAGSVPRNATDRSPFSLPTWQDLTGFAEPVRQAVSSAGTTLTAGPTAGPGAGAPPPVTGPPSRAGAPLGPIAEGSPEGFFATAGPYARQVEQETGVPAALSLAIAANETGYGQQRYMAGANNYHGIQARAGEAGAVPYTDWRPGAGGQQQFYDAAQRSFDSPLSGFRGFAQFLTENPRYGPALARYKQGGSLDQLAADIHAAGYAEDPAYTRKITSIMHGIPEPTGVGEVTAPAGVSPAASTAPPRGTYTKDQLVPNQITEGAAQGLSTAEALAVCGPAAAVAFARANGRNPTLREAKELASSLGLWDVGAGMHGPATQVTLLEKMGVAARLEQGTDWGRVAAEVQRGKPVIVDTPNHYFVASDYDPATGEFEFGQSAGVLRAAKGKTRWRPADLPSLNMGAPRATIYMGGGGP